MSNKKSNKTRIGNELSAQGYSKSAKNAIKQWYQPKNEKTKVTPL